MIYIPILYVLYFVNDFVMTEYQPASCEVISQSYYNFNTIQDYSIPIWNMQIQYNNSIYYGDACASYFAHELPSFMYDNSHYCYQRISELNNLFPYLCKSCQYPQCSDVSIPFNTTFDCYMSTKPTHNSRYDVIFQILPYFPTNDYNATLICPLLFMIIINIIIVHDILCYINLNIDEICDGYIDHNLPYLSHVNSLQYIKLCIDNMNPILMMIFIFRNGNIFAIFNNNTNIVLLCMFFFIITSLCVRIIFIGASVINNNKWKQPIIPVLGLITLWNLNIHDKTYFNIYHKYMTDLLFVVEYVPLLILLTTYHETDVLWTICLVTNSFMIMYKFIEYVNRISCFFNVYYDHNVQREDQLIRPPPSAPGGPYQLDN